MHDRRTFGLIAGASALLPFAAQGQASATRPAEAAALVDFAEKTHPRGIEAKGDAQWRALAAGLEESARQAPVAEYVVRACALLAWFKDGHTTVLVRAMDAGPFGLDLPIRATAFYDALHIVEAAPAHADLLGARVNSVGAFPIEEVIRRFAAVWPANNPAWPHHDAGSLLGRPGFLHGLEVIEGPDAAPVAIEAAKPGESPIRRTLAPGKPVERTGLKRAPSSVEAWAAQAASGNFVRRLDDRKVLYVSLDNVDQPVDRFMVFSREVVAAMGEPAWSKLVVDLRRNPGGNNFLTEPLRKEIGRSRFNRPGGLYVLIGPTTFSAAQNLTNRLERETFAIFAGEPTGGAPNHFGDAKRFEGGGELKAAVSTIPWFDSYPMDKRPWVMPDMLIPRTFPDWAQGRDPVLDAVLAQEAVPPELAGDRTFYFARKSQSAPWRPFWMS